MSWKNKVLPTAGAVLLCALAVTAVTFAIPKNNPHRVVISRFDVPDVEFGSQDFNLEVTGSKVSAVPFGKSIRLKLKLIPGSYNFVASGEGLADKKFAWENRPLDIDWNDVIGISYKVYVESINGTPHDVNMLRIATDIVDGDGEILRANSRVHKGEWLDQRVYFKDLETRYDYQRDWNSVRWDGTGEDKTSLSKVDNGIKSYQLEVIGLESDKPVDLRANQVEVVLYIDEVALIRK